MEPMLHTAPTVNHGLLAESVRFILYRGTGALGRIKTKDSGERARSERGARDRAVAGGNSPRNAPRSHLEQPMYPLGLTVEIRSVTEA